MRTKIALRNLFISQIIILIFLLFAYFVWFPNSFSKLGGFYDTAWMIIFVDLVLGPLLVFIVYKENKKYLKFDINVLLAIQLAAFFYGAYALYLKHPVFNVFVNYQFKLINASYAIPDKVRFKALKPSFFSSPKIVYTQLPENMQERTQFMLGVDLFGKPDIDRRADFYTSHLNSMDEILSKQLDPIVLFNSVNHKSKLNKFIKKWGGVINDYAFFPISGNNKKEMVFVLNKETGEAVDVIDVNPRIILAKINKQNQN